MSTEAFYSLIVIFIFLAVGVGWFIGNRFKAARRRRQAASAANERTEGLKPESTTPQQGGDTRNSPQVQPEQGYSETEGSPKIFISYRRADSSDISGRIYDRLVQHFGTEHVFKDVDSIPLGVDFKRHLDEAVAQCSVFLAVIGADWLRPGDTAKESHLHDSTDFVRIEIESALRRDIPLIPLFVREATMPPAVDLPGSLKVLSYRNGIAIRSDPDFHNDMDRLIRAVESHVQ